MLPPLGKRQNFIQNKLKRTCIYFRRKPMVINQTTVNVFCELCFNKMRSQNIKKKKLSSERI
jgi:hypothetical protein